MDKKEFRLDYDDFNRVAEISSNDKEVFQIIGGKYKKYTKQERVDHFWKSIATKYGFNPNIPTVTNVSGRSALYFMAEPASTEILNEYCKMCDRYVTDAHLGCDRSSEEECIWSKNRKK